MIIAQQFTAGFGITKEFPESRSWPNCISTPFAQSSLFTPFSPFSLPPPRSKPNHQPRRQQGQRVRLGYGTDRGRSRGDQGGDDRGGAVRRIEDQRPARPNGQSLSVGQSGTGSYGQDAGVDNRAACVEAGAAEDQRTVGAAHGQRAGSGAVPEMLPLKVSVPLPLTARPLVRLTGASMACLPSFTAIVLRPLLSKVKISALPPLRL